MIKRYLEKNWVVVIFGGLAILFGFLILMIYIEPVIKGVNYSSTFLLLLLVIYAGLAHIALGAVNFEENPESS